MIHSRTKYCELINSLHIAKLFICTFRKEIQRQIWVLLCHLFTWWGTYLMVLVGHTVTLWSHVIQESGLRVSCIPHTCFLLSLRKPCFNKTFSLHFYIIFTFGGGTPDCVPGFPLALREDLTLSGAQGTTWGCCGSNPQCARPASYLLYQCSGPSLNALNDTYGFTFFPGSKPFCEI